MVLEKFAEEIKKSQDDIFDTINHLSSAESRFKYFGNNCSNYTEIMHQIEIARTMLNCVFDEISNYLIEITKEKR